MIKSWINMFFLPFFLNVLSDIVFDHVLDHCFFIYLPRQAMPGKTLQYLIKIHTMNKASGKKVAWEFDCVNDTNYASVPYIQNQYSLAAPIEIGKLRNLWYSFFYMLTGLMGAEPWRASVWQWSMNLPIRKSSWPCVSAWNDLGSVWESSSEVKWEVCGALHL